MWHPKKYSPEALALPEYCYLVEFDGTDQCVSDGASPIGFTFEQAVTVATILNDQIYHVLERFRDET